MLSLSDWHARRTRGDVADKTAAATCSYATTTAACLCIKHAVKLLLSQVFGPDSQQARVYQTAISPIVTEVLEGFNCTIFAYGQTGTGKTYTMEGGPRNSVDGSNMSAEAGIIPRAIKQIFDAIESDDVTDSSVKVRTRSSCFACPEFVCSCQHVKRAWLNK